MKTYKVNVAGVEIIVEANEHNLKCIQNRNWDYIEIDSEPTHSIEEFMEQSLNHILNNIPTQ